MLAASAIFALIASAVVQAAPSTYSCDVSKAVLSLPSNQTSISVPSNLTPKYITLGVGVQVRFEFSH